MRQGIFKTLLQRASFVYFTFPIVIFRANVHLPNISKNNINPIFIIIGVLALLRNVLSNSDDMIKNLLLLMGLRNVETWILQFTNFLYNVISPDLTLYILEQHALNACCLLWGSNSKQFMGRLGRATCTIIRFRPQTTRKDSNLQQLKSS